MSEIAETTVPVCGQVAGQSKEPYAAPAKVLITGGRGLGGVTSFAEALREGFSTLGISVEIIAPSAIFRRWHELCDPHVLKILSTTAVFAAPFARRAICMAHGISRAHLQGIRKMVAVIATFKIANASSGAQLVAVSDYVAAHLQTIFDLRIDGVVHNPLRPEFLESLANTNAERTYITYVGVLDPVKNMHRILPAIRTVLDQNPGLRACIAGDGPQRKELERIAAGDKRISFPGRLNPLEVRDLLRQSRVFISGTPTEALGIAYLEALSQGCAVAMPASGGGLEIAPDLIGRWIHLFPSSLQQQEVSSAIERAMLSGSAKVSLDAYAPKATALSYLRVDSQFSPAGLFEHPAHGAPYVLTSQIDIPGAAKK